MRWLTVMAIAPALAVSACGERRAMTIEDAVIRLPAAPGRPGAAYFTLKGGPQADTLLSVSTPAAIRTELHESMAEGHMMSMRAMRDVPVPARATVRFEPGGKHIMLYDMNPALRAGGTTRITLNFASGLKLEADARLAAPGEAINP